MRQPEAAFKQKLITAYRVAYPQGWYQYNPAHRRRGVPDLQFLLPGGQVIWLEAKVSPYKASKIQLAVHQEMARAGGRVLLVSLDRTTQRLEILRATGQGPGSYDHPQTPHWPLEILERPAPWNHLAVRTP